MKKGIFLFCMIGMTLSTVHGQDQGIDAFKKRLAEPDPSYKSRVVVTEHGTAAAAVRAAQTTPTANSKVTGYRVRIFFDNSQQARKGAETAVARFKELYPDIPVYMVYNSPYFKVTVGDCLSLEEANILLGKIKDAFDRAFPVQEEIMLNAFGKSSAAADNTPEPFQE